VKKSNSDDTDINFLQFEGLKVKIFRFWWIIWRNMNHATVKFGKEIVCKSLHR